VSQSSGGSLPAARSLPERALDVSLAGLLVILPFSHTAAAVRALLAVGLAALVAIAWRDGAALLRLRPPYFLPLLAWMAWCLASIAWTVDRPLTVSELRGEFFYGFVMIMVVHVAATRGTPERLLVAAAAFSCLLVGGTTLAWEITQLGAYFAPGAGNTTSTVLLLFPVAFVLALSQESGTRARRAGIAMCVALLAAGLVTFNRTLGPALAVELVLIVALLDGRRLARRVAAVLAVAIAFAVLQAGVAHVVRFTGDGVNAQVTGDDPRRALWGHVAVHIAEAPLTGHGYGREILGEKLRAPSGNAYLTHAHNVFLDAALQVGIPGAVLLLVLFASIAAAGLRYARSGDAVARACGTALVAVVAGTITRNLSDDLWVRNNALLFWLVAGALAGIAERRLSGSPATR